MSRFLQKHDMDLICRAHQVVEDGYEFFSKRQLVTLFSAPNYCGEFDNAGAMMSVDESLLCSFQVGFLICRLTFCLDAISDMNRFLLDLETSREETKVRLRGHEHWQTHHSSAKAEKEVKKESYELFHVQQVRAEINTIFRCKQRDRDQDHSDAEDHSRHPIRRQSVYPIHNPSERERVLPRVPPIFSPGDFAHI